jgi:argininosuccinate lyase
MADSFATGSSMLPQKKNPDIAELARGKAGRLIGHLTGFLATLKGLPLSYNRDLQEDKEPLFDALDQLSLALPALAGLLATATFDFDRMRAAADSPAGSAVDLAHALVGRLVRDSLERRVPMAELVENDPQLGQEAMVLLEPGMAVSRRTTPGGAGPGAVALQLKRFREQLERERALVLGAGS